MSAEPLSREERRVLVERLHRDLGFAPVPVAARARLSDLMQIDLAGRVAAEERAERLRTALRRSGDGLVDALAMSKLDVRYLDSIRVLIDATLADDDDAQGEG